MHSAEQEWRRRVARVLGEQAFDSLRTLTPEGLLLEPLYAPSDAGGPRVSRQDGAAPWAIVQRMDDPDAGRAAVQAADDMSGGASLLRLCMAGATEAFGYGVPSGALSAALRGVDLDRQAVQVALAADAAAPALDALMRHLEASRLPAGLALLSFRANAVGLWARPVLRRLLDAGFAGPLLCASGRAHHNAGADACQEIAAVLSAAVAGLRSMEALGVPRHDWAGRLTLELCADADVFTGIAKFRAARLLWAEVEAACGASPAPVRLEAETSYRMLARRDVPTNMLRNTLAVFAAAIGGADAISVLPHTMSCGLPDAFARRMARNQQIILMEESHLAAVTDPAAGSGAFDSLTDALAEAAWDHFQRLEAAGGLAAALADGTWPAALATARQRRREAVATGAAPILGVTLYPDAGERPASVLAGRQGAETPFDADRDGAGFEEGAAT